MEYLRARKDGEGESEGGRRGKRETCEWRRKTGNGQTRWKKGKGEDGDGEEEQERREQRGAGTAAWEHEK
jgi:hypothetical protein